MLPIAFVAEYLYCQRSSFYYLSGAENGEEENPYIQSGRAIHSNTDIKGSRYRDQFKEVTGVRLVNYHYGLVGKADLVRELEDELIPVEYKSGQLKRAENHRFQLILQSFCLRDQFCKQIRKGVVYFYEVNECCEYEFSSKEFKKAEDTLMEIREKLSIGNISLFGKISQQSCVHCSFYNICMPYLE